jgi:hypothetical protein
MLFCFLFFLILFLPLQFQTDKALYHHFIGKTFYSTSVVPEDNTLRFIDAV